MNKDKAFCKHGVHLTIICLQCQGEQNAALNKKQAEIKAKERVYKAAEKLKF